MGEKQSCGIHSPRLRAQEKEAIEGHTQASQRGGDAHVIGSKAAGHMVTDQADVHGHRQTWAGQRLHTQADQRQAPRDKLGTTRQDRQTHTSKALCFALVFAPPLGIATPSQGAASSCAASEPQSLGKEPIQRLRHKGEGKKPHPQLLGRWQPHLHSGAYRGHGEIQSDPGEPTVWAPKAGRLLLPASCQAAMVRFRQGHWGQASWVSSQDPVGSQLTMATWVAAKGVYTLAARGWRQGEGLRQRGDLWFGGS